MSVRPPHRRARWLLAPTLILTLIWIGSVFCSITALGVESHRGMITFRWAARPPNAAPTAPGPSEWVGWRLRFRMRFDGIGLLPRYHDSGWFVWMPPTAKVGQTLPSSRLHRLDLPLWPPALAIFLLWFYLSRHRVSPPGVCRQCSYNLTGNVSGICPECGEPVR
jgi:hypothetical protein